MNTKICLALFTSLAVTTAAKAFDFNPSLSLTATYAATQHYTAVTYGKFETTNSKLNGGFELTNKFYLANDYFIKTGLRYGSSKTTINGLNMMPGRYDTPHPFVWEKRYAAVAVPVLLGKEFTAAGRRGDVYAGISAGLLMVTMSKVSGTTPMVTDLNNPEGIAMEVWGGPNQTPDYFLATGDIGGSYQPFKSLPGFSLGLMASVQLNKSQPYSYTARATTLPSNNQFRYEASHTQRLVNTSLLLTYSFGRNARKAEQAH